MLELPQEESWIGTVGREGQRIATSTAIAGLCSTSDGSALGSRLQLCTAPGWSSSSFNTCEPFLNLDPPFLALYYSQGT